MSAADWTSIEVPQDIRLVVADMDGTLLDEHSEIPQGFWPMLARLRSRGVEFVPGVRTPVRYLACHVRR